MFKRQRQCGKFKFSRIHFVFGFNITVKYVISEYYLCFQLDFFHIITLKRVMHNSFKNDNTTKYRRENADNIFTFIFDNR